MDLGGELLKAELLKRKQRNPNYSLRAFAKWLQISPAQLSQLISGKRATTPELLRKVNKKLELSPVEQKQLLQDLLVQKKLSPATMPIKTLEEDQFRLISDWYHLAILSLTKIEGAKSDPRWIAKEIGISVDEANQAIQRLVRLNLLDANKFLQIGESFEVSSTIPSSAIRKFHKQNLDIASEKIETIDIKYREFQSVSIAVDPDKLSQFKKLMDRFLADAMDLASSQKSKSIYQLNVQLFPITQIKEKK